MADNLDVNQQSANLADSGINFLGTLGSLGIGIANTVLQAKNSARNLAMQQGWLDYQKDLQNRIFEREDNAVQRRLKDVTAAGFSPLAALGQSASAGQVVSTSAPQRSTTQIDPQMIGQALTLASQLKTQGLERDYIKAQTDALRTKNETDAYNLEYYRSLGMPTNGSMLERLVNIGFNAFGTNLKALSDNVQEKVKSIASSVGEAAEYIKSLQFPQVNISSPEIPVDRQAIQQFDSVLDNVYSVRNGDKIPRVEFTPGTTKKERWNALKKMKQEVDYTYGDLSYAQQYSDWLNDALDKVNHGN